MRGKRFSIFVFFVCSAFLSASPSYAQDVSEEVSGEQVRDAGNNSVEEELYFAKDELITGTSKREVKVGEAPANVTIITHEDIIQSGMTNLGEVFRRVLGMDVVTKTAAETDVSARGFADKLLDGERMSVLIDGRTFYLEFVGSTLWFQFPVPLDDIKRIEVIKGPMSSLYGNKAMLGVINIITYKPEETRALISAGGGRFKMADANFIYAGKFAENYWYKISANYHRTDEFSSPPGDITSKDREDFSTAAQFDFNPQKETNINLSGGFTGTYDKIQVGALSPWNDRRGFIVGKVGQDLGKWGKLDFQSFWERHDLTASRFGWNIGALDTVDAEIRHSFSVDFTPNIKNTTTYGFEYRFVDGSFPTIDALNDYAGFLQNETRFYDRVIVTGGVRVDDQVNFAGVNTAANGSVVFLVDPKYTLRLSVASAFNTPTTIHYFSDFASPVVPAPFTTTTFAGNRNLKAERIIYFDVGNTIYPIDKLKLRADFFYYRLNDMIVSTASLLSPTALQLSFGNDGGARAIGGEIGLEASIFKWLTGYAYWAYEDFKAINGNTNPASNLGNPRNKASAGLRGKWKNRITADLEFHYVRHHQAQNGAINFPFTPVVEVGDVYLLDLRVGYWPIKDHLELAVSANNILNCNTPQVPDFDTTFNLAIAEKPQFNIWGSLRYLF